MAEHFKKHRYLWTLIGVSLLSLIGGLIIAANFNWTNPLSAKTEVPIVGGGFPLLPIWLKRLLRQSSISVPPKGSRAAAGSLIFLRDQEIEETPRTIFLNDFSEGISLNQGNTSKRASVQALLLTEKAIS